MQLKDRDETIRLLLEASRQSRLSGLQDMLRVISQAAGAVMWEVAPGSDPDAKKGRQFVLGSWFEDPNVRIWYYLTLEDSLTGETIRAGIPRFSPVVADEPSTPERA